MTRHKSTDRIWRTTKSGLFYPDGTVIDRSNRSSHSYLESKKKALELIQLFEKNGVRLNPNSDLRKLIDNAILLSDSWILGTEIELTNTRLLKAHYLLRIADALLPLDTASNRAQYLKKLASGNLDLMKHEPSAAKDFLWELELWSSFRRSSIDATLEEPDIAVHLDEVMIGIACKKVYSSGRI